LTSFSYRDKRSCQCLCAAFSCCFTGCDVTPVNVGNYKHHRRCLLRHSQRRCRVGVIDHCCDPVVPAATYAQQQQQQQLSKVQTGSRAYLIPSAGPTSAASAGNSHRSAVSRLRTRTWPSHPRSARSTAADPYSVGSNASIPSPRKLSAAAAGLTTQQHQYSATRRAHNARDAVARRRAA
jgi:hypothetical protein